MSSKDAMGSITFKWKPRVRESPTEPPSSYRMKVWQLMQGQNGSTAMKTNQPIITKDVANLTEATVSGIWTGPCKPPYLCDFIWTVEVMGAAGHNGCTSEPTMFSVTEGTTTCTENIFPGDKTQISSKDAMNGITFKWKPAGPGQSSSYRLKVWQLMQGQNGTTAMRSNKPIATKDVDNLSEATINGLWTGPCKPPYLCDYIWSVEMRSAAGQTACTSEPTAFSIAPQYIIQLDSIKVSCTATPGVYSFKYCITNPNAGTAKLITLTATSSIPAGASITTFAPPLNTTINSNGQLCITGTINAANNLSNICIGAAIQDVANSFWQAQRDTCVNVQPCKCETCDDKHFTLNAPPPQISYANNLISFVQSINVTTTPAKAIKSIKAELVYFEMIPENDMCIPCNKDAATYGHFTNGTNSEQWNGSQTNLNITITSPQLTPCCSALFKWCIRYKIEFKDCTTCNKLVCYEKKKDGCDKTGGDDKGLNH
jgi:hypothetical protein